MKTAGATVLWKSYRNRVYGSDPLPLTQERELSLAFYAGIEIAFRMVEKIGNLDIPDEQRVQMFQRFRDEAKEAASIANLDRATGTS